MSTFCHLIHTYHQFYILHWVSDALQWFTKFLINFKFRDLFKIIFVVVFANWLKYNLLYFKINTPIIGVLTKCISDAKNCLCLMSAVRDWLVAEALDNFWVGFRFGMSMFSTIALWRQEKCCISMLLCIWCFSGKVIKIKPYKLFANQK